MTEKDFQWVKNNRQPIHDDPSFAYSPPHQNGSINQSLVDNMTVAELCVDCRKVFSNNHDADYLRDFFRWTDDYRANRGFSFTDSLPTLPRFSESFCRGCAFCGFLRDLILSQDTIDQLQEQHGVSLSAFEGCEIHVTIQYHWCRVCHDDTFLTVDVTFAHEVGLEYWLAMSAVENHDALAARLDLAPTPSQSYLDGDVVKWLQGHIAHCETDHDANSEVPTELLTLRHSTPNTNYLPPRLIAVEQGKVRLVLRQDLLASASVSTEAAWPQYTALSYCWGSSQDAQFQLTTKLSTLAQRQAGISDDELQTVPALRDAVLITRALSVPYVWIDSLCILQDDISDWERHCLQMSEVYGKARVTLTASASTSCREGFLQRVGQSVIVSYESTMEPKIQGLVHLRFHAISRRRYGSIDRLTRAYAGSFSSPVFSRGWTVQERLLSVRQIVFGRRNVHFACPYEISIRSKRESGSTRNDAFDVMAVAQSIARIQDEDLHVEWGTIQKAFGSITQESFSVPTDFLPAISGLATIFNQRLQDEYIVGHWKWDLNTSLIFQRRALSRDSLPKAECIGRFRASGPYVLPSWSRFDGKFETDGMINSHSRVTTFHQEAQRFTVEIALARQDNPYGAVTAATLHITTWAMCLRETKVLSLTSVLHRNRGRDDPVQEKKDGTNHGWIVTLTDSDGEEHECEVYLDYTLTKQDVFTDALDWKWVLFGSRSLSDSADGDDFVGRRGARFPYGLLVQRLKGENGLPEEEDEGGSHQEQLRRIGIFKSEGFWWKGWTYSRFVERSIPLDKFTAASKLEELSIF